MLRPIELPTSELEKGVGMAGTNRYGQCTALALSSISQVEATRRSCFLLKSRWWLYRHRVST